MNKKQSLKRKKLRVRRVVSGTATKPRLSVYRSLSNVFAQLIDDVDGKTLASASTLKIKQGKKIEAATEVGKQIAAAAKKLGITEVSFDRGGRIYHGRIKAVAEGARAGGLKF